MLFQAHTVFVFVLFLFLFFLFFLFLLFWVFVPDILFLNMHLNFCRYFLFPSNMERCWGFSEIFIF